MTDIDRSGDSESPDDAGVPRFSTLALPAEILRAVEDVGYEAPSPIQAAAIPVLLEGRDLIGQAQTGTGKTAAFALPLLASIDLDRACPQMLVLTPTRELALQVSEAIQVYAHHLRALHVLPVYGGQGMGTQLRRLRRGVHVVVGTPGRIQDHLRRGTLDLAALRSLVIDEADEMLRMGFIEEVEAILEQTPESRQTALFSATIPAKIHAIAKRFLRDPARVKISTKTATVETTEQRYVAVTGYNKLEALTRILEVESFDAMLIFVRTRSSTATLAEKLEARGFAAAPLSGEMRQEARQRTIERLKSGQLDIIVCTDVAARGLDVERVSHVINFDIPTDPEAYVHRVGRTGRAGRGGQAILFVARRERRLLKMIERTTRQPVERMAVPTGAQIGQRRISELKDLLSDTIRDTELGFFEAVVESYMEERAAEAARESGDIEEIEGEAETAPGTAALNVRSVAAALIYLYQRDRPLVVEERRLEDEDRGPQAKTHHRASKASAGGKLDSDGRRYRLDVGRSHGLEARHVVGCIANEAGISSRHISKIKIYDEYATVELPPGMPRALLDHLSNAWVCGRQLGLRVLDDPGSRRRNKKRRNLKSREGDRPKGRGGSSRSRRRTKPV